MSKKNPEKYLKLKTKTVLQGIASSILKFADDNKLFKEVRHNTDCEALQRDLDNVVLWAQKWQMQFNVKKCKVMHVGRH